MTPKPALARTRGNGRLAAALTRHELALSMRRVVLHAESPAAASPDAPACAAAILPAREGLLGLAERLEDGRPVHPGGVERARTLLSDPTGPLYCADPEHSLIEMLWWIADGLRLCPPHQWSCPVTMKADPEHVAWTCGRCGHIAVTDDAAVRPA
jgi:hypothetical protein